MKAQKTPLETLRHHVTGAIERGEAEAITEQRVATPEESTLYKYVGYAYPTSDKARDLGFYNEGRWYLELQTRNEKTFEHIGDFKTKQEALDSAANFYHPFGRYSH